MYLLVTTVVSALRRSDTAAQSLVSWAAGVEVTEQYLSAMTLYDLELSVQRIERRDRAQGEKLRTWLSRSVRTQFRDRILPIDDTVAARCASLQVPDPQAERDSFNRATALVRKSSTAVVPRGDKRG